MADPCRCQTPDEARDCLRSGLPMVGRLYDLCRGVACVDGVSESYRRAWDSRGRGVCRHKGVETGELVQCGSCGPAVRLIVFGCSVHGSCTTARQAEGHGCCLGCPEWEGRS